MTLRFQVKLKIGGKRYWYPAGLIWTLSHCETERKTAHHLPVRAQFRCLLHLERDGWCFPTAQRRVTERKGDKFSSIFSLFTK